MMITLLLKLTPRTGKIPLTFDNQTFHAVFNKIQQMATFRMTLKTTYTETKTKQQIGPACTAEKVGF